MGYFATKNNRRATFIREIRVEQQNKNNSFGIFHHRKESEMLSYSPKINLCTSPFKFSSQKMFTL